LLSQIRQLTRALRMSVSRWQVELSWDAIHAS
jgi:hypothetical protein